MRYCDIKMIARKLRNNPTKSEQILWHHLRERKLKGRRFLRQHPLIYQSDRNNHFFFIPDFYCPEEKLVVELDGKIHDYQKDYDKWRDEIIKSKGLKVLRIKNEELFYIIQVLKKIECCFGNK